MSHNNYYTTGNQLDFAYFKEHYRLIAIDLSRQTNLKDPQQINFTGKLEKDNGATLYFVTEKQQKKQPLIFHKILSRSYNNGNKKNCKFVRWYRQ